MTTPYTILRDTIEEVLRTDVPPFGPSGMRIVLENALRQALLWEDTVAVNAIVLTNVHKIDGATVLETACSNFDTYKALPQVVSYQGIICGKTGWSSDRCYACYKSTAAIATVVVAKGSK